MQNIQALYVVPSLTTNIIDLINLLVSLIPYPFGGNYLLVEIFMQTNVVSVPAIVLGYFLFEELCFLFL